MNWAVVQTAPAHLAASATWGPLTAQLQGLSSDIRWVMLAARTQPGLTETAPLSQGRGVLVRVPSQAPSWVSCVFSLQGLCEPTRGLAPPLAWLVQGSSCGLSPRGFQVPVGPEPLPPSALLHAAQSTPGAAAPGAPRCPSRALPARCPHGPETGLAFTLVYNPPQGWGSSLTPGLGIWKTPVHFKNCGKIRKL